MAPAKIQVDYDGLAAVARRLDDEADDIQSLLRAVTRLVHTLETGDWVGVGAEEFFDEMHYDVFPAMRRLIDALSEAASGARHIRSLFGDAEREASEQFR